METTILNIINTVLTNRGRENITDLKPEMNLRNDIGLDSLDLAELTVRIEAEFDIDIFKDEMVFTVSEIFQKLKFLP